jgi:hypothetical protein
LRNSSSLKSNHTQAIASVKILIEDVLKTEVILIIACNEHCYLWHTLSSPNWIVQSSSNTQDSDAPAQD